MVDWKDHLYIYEGVLNFSSVQHQSQSVSYFDVKFPQTVTTLLNLKGVIFSLQYKKRLRA